MSINLLPILLLTLLVAIVETWRVLIVRLWHGEPILPVEPRRQVPWHGRDLFAIFVAYVVFGLLVVQVGVAVFGPEFTNAPVIKDPSALQADHPIMRVFHDASWSVRIGCFIMAVVVAPFSEEILYRLFLQGWLEKFDRRFLRRLAPGLSRIVRWGTLPVIVSSLLFAVPHFRGEVQKRPLEHLLFIMAGVAVVNLLSVAIAVTIARWRGATWADLGWVPDKLGADVWLGFSAFALVAVPIYALQVGLKTVLPPNWTADPIPLFFFAVVLGTLYLRTHRIVPSIVAHMSLNSVSMLLLWISVSQGAS